MKASFNTKAAVCGILMTLFALSGHDASAQRTVWGQRMVSVHFMKNLFPSASAKVMGGEAYYGQYFSSFYWQAGAQFTAGTKEVPVNCFNVSGGAMYRVFGTRSRMFSMYVGGNALVGVDFTSGNDAFKEVVSSDSGSVTIPVDDGDEKKYGTGFVYGIEPRLELEFFPFKTLAIVGGAALPVKFKTQQDIVTGRFYVGARLNF